MGREIKRVPVGFDWPIGETWWGFLVSGVECLACDGGFVKYRSHDYQTPNSDGLFHCMICEGEAHAYVTIEVPSGSAYQLWETTSEGSPTSPAFEDPKELARWLTDNNASTFGYMTTTYEKWLAFIMGPGWAMSAVSVGGAMKSGADFVTEKDSTES